jgi:hypothetical protein
VWLVSRVPSDKVGFVLNSVTGGSSVNGQASGSDITLVLSVGLWVFSHSSGGLIKVVMPLSSAQVDCLFVVSVIRIIASVLCRCL